MRTIASLLVTLLLAAPLAAQITMTGEKTLVPVYSSPEKARLALAGDADGMLLVYTNGFSKLHRVHIDAAGNASAPQPFPEVLGAPVNARSSNPSVAKIADIYLVAWSTEVGLRDIVAQRVKDDGTFLDPLPRTLNLGSDVRVSVGNGTYEIISTDAPTNRRSSGLLMRQQMIPEGTLIGRIDVIGRGDVAAVNASTFAWSDFQLRNLPIGICCETQLQFLSRPAPGGGEGGERTLVRAEGYPAVSANVATSGHGFLFVWPSYHLRGALLDANGALVSSPDGFLIAPAVDVNPDTRPEVVWDGVRYFVAWEQVRLQGGSDILGIYVGADGKPASDVLEIAAVPTRNERRPAVAAIGHGKVAVAYEIVTGGSAQVGMRVLSSVPQRPRAARR